MNWVFGNLLNICINNCKYTNIEIHTCKTMGIHGNMIHGDTNRNNSIRSNEGTPFHPVPQLELQPIQAIDIL